ncbi:MAG TPA: MOSC domain-containing protein [Thermoplasmata archaeon]|nr:MOSC domain-containing protein [Thermoplasmata archaeon]
MAGSDQPSIGRVVRLGAKPRTPGQRGLPKPALAKVTVARGGVEGDYNVWRQEERGGDPDYALLVMPEETLEQLNHEGWPVRPGDLGENITTSGVPYAAFEPPCRFRVGSVLAEVSKACDPCDTLTLLPYVGRARGPEFLKTMMGRRGWYARVVNSGEIREGDPIRLER